MSHTYATMRGTRVIGGGTNIVGLPPSPAWMGSKDRACAPDRAEAPLFTSDERSDLAAAAAICRRRCPFLEQRRAWAEEHDEKNHVWGGRVLSWVAS